MGMNQRKAGSVSEVCSTIKSLESGSNNMETSSSPILNGGSETTSHPDFKGIGSRGFSTGEGTVKRESDMSSGNHFSTKKGVKK